jgi:hypothetical protein
MKPPIIVDNYGDTMIFTSIEDAEVYLEPIDVENGEYIAYDSEGRLLELIPTHPRITIRCSEQEPMHSDELRELLVSMLEETGTARDRIITESLKELVERSLKFKTS